MSAFGLFYIRKLKPYSRISWSFCSLVIFLRIDLPIEIKNKDRTMSSRPMTKLILLRAVGLFTNIKAILKKPIISSITASDIHRL
ncbi:hypothetical protein D3C80_1910950 [compost metagenome]